jgi:hypothetical protein
LSLPRVLLMPKDRIVLDVLHRYPPLRELVLETVHRNGGCAGNHCRDARAVLTGGNDHSDDDGAEEEIARLFAGAARTWLFDCGQSTQLSVQHTPSIRPGRISLIFVTHCHGNHSFSLPGLLCLMGTDRTRDNPPVKIYGQRFMSTKVLKAFQSCILILSSK